jgi:hypothetical protein
LVALSATLSDLVTTTPRLVAVLVQFMIDAEAGGRYRGHLGVHGWCCRVC